CSIFFLASVKNNLSLFFSYLQLTKVFMYFYSCATGTVGLMILAILSTMLLLLFIKEPPVIHIGKERLVNFKKNLRESFLTKRTGYTIAFALTGAAAFEAAGAMAGPFLTDHHLGLESIGFFFGVPVVIAMLAGGLTGGFLSDKMKRKTSVTVFLCGFVAMVLSISATGFLRPDASSFVWITLFTAMYFFTGMFTSASYALFMNVTNPKLGATQFSTFMAATNGCEAWAVWTAGIIAASHSYSHAFAAMSVASLLSLFFLSRIKER
ncbi:MAG: MFS transporter, partial [Bacteroidia bacterium]|nr:MFS transporter [Bacteroidia bacterium]